MPEQHYDTEITLGVGKLLGLFFLLVVLCGVFLGIGYSLGKSSAKGDTAATTAEAAPAGSISNAPKPGASQTSQAAKPADCPAGQNCDQQQNSQTDLTFYKAVEQKDATPALTQPEQAPPPNTQAASSQIPQGQAAKGQPEMKPPMTGGVMVQVAAVTKREDAEALQAALISKQYPVIVTTLPGDKFFRVQIGPFADIKDADAMKSRLAADGYNAIVKR